MCSRSSDPFYVLTYYIQWVTTSWTHSIRVLIQMAYGDINKDKLSIKQRQKDKPTIETNIHTQIHRHRETKKHINKETQKKI